ncbi:sodium channel protein 60E [Caerostris extrusa]|uniref:Sodium channel protein n=1 Tax=Caerostris extrusa TaxID=172846 RepID=A0AAV4MRM7_CAEEX|nr:sodium channel protein 60E [Caerostris extrusa]
MPTDFPNSAVNTFENSSRRPSSDQSLSVSWTGIHCGHFYRRCQRLFRTIFRGCVRLRHYLAVIVNDPLFDLVITVCIFLNTAFLSVEHYGMSVKTERTLKLGNLLWAATTSRSKWNLFDLTVVVFSLADLSFETVGGLSVLRTFRLLRVVKLAQAWPTMRLLLTIIASTLGAVGNMTLVLAVIVYIFAILGVQLFSDLYTPENFAPDPWNFTDFWHSLLMMFRILCGEWVQPLWDCMRVSGEKYQVCIVLFLVALTMGNFLVLNLFLAMLLNSFNSQELKRTSDFSQRVYDTLQQSRRTEDSPGRLSSFSSTRTNISMGKQVSNSRANSVVEEQETQHDSKDSSPMKDRDKKHASKNLRTAVHRACINVLMRKADPSSSIGKRGRKIVLLIVDHRAFEWTVLLLIFSSSVILSLLGVVCMHFEAFRTLRALRPLRAISRWEGMKIVVNAPHVGHPIHLQRPPGVSCVLVDLQYHGVQFFGGRFYRCVDKVGNTLPVQITPDMGQCLTLNYSWINRDINFDNVGNAYLALFQVATFEGWMEVMEYAVDTTEVGHQPYAEANFPAYIYFVTFIICGSFFTLNLFIGVIIDNFNMLKKKYEGGIVEVFLTDSQRAYYTAMLKLGRRKPQRIVTRPHNRYLRICYDLAMSRRFEMVVFLFIILNMVAMTVEHYQQPEHITSILDTLNIVFTVLFCTEAIIKIIGLRQYYFTFPWNVFDLIVIILSVISIIFEEALQQLVISPTLFRVIRLVRIGRILRLIKAAKGIRKLLFALVISLPALFNIGALLFLITFVYAIIGMFLFGHVRLPDASNGSSGLSEMVNFQTFANSMVLLFRLTTSAGWNDILDSLMVQPPDCDPQQGDCGHPTLAVIYLVTYIIINFMVIINMYIAVILENLSQASKEETGISGDDIEMFYVCWSQYDPNATQFIHHSQLSDFVASLDPPLGIEKPNEPALVAMNIPIATGDKIHCLDILHSLVNLVLGDVEDTEEFRTVQRQVDQRFRKSFPTRNLVEITTTTLKRKQQDNAAKVIQRTYKRHQ